MPAPLEIGLSLFHKGEVSALPMQSDRFQWERSPNMTIYLYR